MTKVPLIAAYHEGAPIPFVNHIIWNETVIFVRVFTDGTIEQHIGLWSLLDMKLYFTIGSLLLAACAISQVRAPVVDWKAMDEESPIVKRVPGGAVVAAAAAMQAVIERHGVEEFAGCRHAADGLDVTVLPAKEGSGEVFFVIVSQHFTACGDPNDERAPHWDEAYAVTADGRIVERARSEFRVSEQAPEHSRPDAGHHSVAPTGRATGGEVEADGGAADGGRPDSLLW